VHNAQPGHGNAYRILARILFSAKKTSEARDVASAGVNVEGESFLGWCDLSRYNEAIGDFSDALMASEQAAKLQPDNPHPKADIERLRLKLDSDLVANT
ncbi:TPA: hypothetical protein MAC15_005781, partial [Klebsiella pneumoniae]|nr:hypothetical protein [Klebsiella pneumoniae]HBS1663021.1 hypothetical protein [Klebsiella pneumoniae]